MNLVRKTQLNPEMQNIFILTYTTSNYVQRLSVRRFHGVCDMHYIALTYLQYGYGSKKKDTPQN